LKKGHLEYGEINGRIILTWIFGNEVVRMGDG
jgi:hypothetical protein